MITRTGVFGSLPKSHHDQLVSLARKVSFPIDARIFNEGGQADRFWIIHTGTVALDLHVPGRRAAVIERLGAGKLLGWSWLVPPRRWQLGAQANSPVRAYEFDAAAVRRLCEKDPVLNHALYSYVAGMIARRLQAARTRLLDLYAPYGAGPAP
ncbi:cyclic nucleotide-binding domain-containing protein [Streptomyces jeddahensis]|uniref:Cyclic nucleotide-binding domain protein n=1 Tax=Streptomyces jeddahensis TaxID=1716141 RepID=A0A177HGK7_9ACTN|nr:cyclic nucleotide-binding domain-containing protein [Streptomyces jeddahensis]OAH09916.1 cyclic nucleotide-binding domain protein [Streptomyces jeddahensis]